MAGDYKTCDICKDKTNCNFDLLLFGDWQQSRDIVVHYFCLLLSTNLPQRGKDCSGINGFLLRDIRKEINAAAKRVCCFCGRANASIQCHKCNDYFHICCGRQNRCLLTFHGDFRSYCDDCIPKTELQPVGLKSRPSSFERCSICREQMGLYNEVIFIFGKCCNKGYAHNVCVQKYALAAGYYLRCLWCRSKEFRDSVRLQGVFVPDRDAHWEIQKDTYVDLYRGHRTCNMEVCLCPRGRDYNKGKWSLILCSLCGSMGAHNPKCLSGKENAKEPMSSFKCATCARTESTVINRKEGLPTENVNDVIDKSIFMTKTNSNKSVNAVPNCIASFSDDDDVQSTDSFVTVIPLQNLELNSSIGNSAAINRKVYNASIKTSVEVTCQKSDDKLEMIEIASSDEDTANVKIQKPATPPPSNTVDMADDETQVFESSCPDTEAVAETSPSQHPISCDSEVQETQILESSCPDAVKTQAAKEASPSQHPISHNIEDEETQIFDVCTPNISATQHTESENTTEPFSLTSVPRIEHTQEIACIQNTNPPDESNQSPVVSSSSQAEENEEWISLEVFEYDDVQGKCMGTATVRINMRDQRFAGMSLEHIEQNSSQLLSDSDVIARSDDCGIFAKIDAIIAEYAT
ncbi:pineapple eye protein [Anastrepha obliqua]|uniref:pineapple eye protein n=1 Tax=Anastrepha obliqua TaxID=95512 RepID=UPI00240A3830|nr:pineapple eye protein [Anastrepha obliqua]